VLSSLHQLPDRLGAFASSADRSPNSGWRLLRCHAFAIERSAIWHDQGRIGPGMRGSSSLLPYSGRTAEVEVADSVVDFGGTGMDEEMDKLGERIERVGEVGAMGAAPASRL